MEQAGLHRGLALRLEVLANRIRTLKDKMSGAEGLRKIEGLAGIERLERLSADPFGALDDFIMRTDSRYSPEKHPAQVSKPSK
jgi:hypothetical protein